MRIGFCSIDMDDPPSLTSFVQYETDEMGVRSLLALVQMAGLDEKKEVDFYISIAETIWTPIDGPKMCFKRKNHGLAEWRRLKIRDAEVELCTECLIEAMPQAPTRC